MGQKASSQKLTTRLDTPPSSPPLGAIFIVASTIHARVLFHWHGGSFSATFSAPQSHSPPGNTEFRIHHATFHPVLLWTCHYSLRVYWRSNPIRFLSSETRGPFRMWNQVRLGNAFYRSVDLAMIQPEGRSFQDHVTPMLFCVLVNKVLASTGLILLPTKRTNGTGRNRRSSRGVAQNDRLELWLQRKQLTKCCMVQSTIFDTFTIHTIHSASEEVKVL